MSFGYSAASLADPDGANAAVAALRWIEGVLLGPVATSVAVIGVAAVGMMMLSGRIDVRRAAGVVLGAFILFGAPTIAAALQALAGGSSADASPPAFVATYVPPPAYAPAPAPPPHPPPPMPDPYAGASVPRR